MIAIVHLEVRLLVEAPLRGSPKRIKKVGSELVTSTLKNVCLQKKCSMSCLGLRISTYTLAVLFRDSADEFDEVTGVHEFPCLKFDDTSGNSHKCGPRKASH